MEQLFALLIVLMSLALSGRCTDVFRKYDFPDGFVFGAGSSAYQWEGAVAGDGRTPSAWDTFCHSRNISNGDIASDGYHKYKGDVQLMADTGLDVFRFSISWSRLIPYRRGLVNQKGLQFYKNLIQELVSRGIEPHVTLYHFDHPQYLEDEYGGWLNHRIIKDFTAYANVCFREFGKHVKFWTTVNEANMISISGYTDGTWPPGHCSFPDRNCSLGNSSTETYIVAHNMLLAHASASRLYKQKYKNLQKGSVGFNIYTIGFISESSNDDDIQRAKDFYMGWMLEPLIFGDYPDEMRRIVGSRLPVFSKDESELVKGSSDFIGINHYIAASVTNIKVNSSLSENPNFYSDVGVFVNILKDKNDLYSWALEAVLEYIKQSFGNPPVYILENGIPDDTQRIEYLQAYIGSVLKSIRNGSDTRGYFVWSFMDQFEISGYDLRFGLYSVNFSDPHRKRSPKLSAHWYSGFLNGQNAFIESQDIIELQNNFSTSVS